VFHTCRLSLARWFPAIYRVTENKNNVLTISRGLGRGISYSILCRVKGNLSEAMRQRESRRLPQGVGFANDGPLAACSATGPVAARRTNPHSWLQARPTAPAMRTTCVCVKVPQRTAPTARPPRREIRWLCRGTPASWHFGQLMTLTGMLRHKSRADDKEGEPPPEAAAPAGRPRPRSRSRS